MDGAHQETTGQQNMPSFQPKDKPRLSGNQQESGPARKSGPEQESGPARKSGPAQESGLARKSSPALRVPRFICRPTEVECSVTVVSGKHERATQQ